jgi:hypothetical protein
MLAVLSDLVDEGQAVRVAPDVDHRPVDAKPLRLSKHREDRRDPDPARDEPETARGGSVAGHRQRKRVTGSSGGDRRTHCEAVVHLDGPPAAIGYAPHRDSIRVAHCRITVQRVLPDAAAGQVNVDVRARKPRRQRLAVRGGQGQHHHVLVVGHHPSVHHAKHMCVVAFRHQRRAPDRRREPPDARHDNLRESQKWVMAGPARGAGRDVGDPRKLCHQR